MLRGKKQTNKQVFNEIRPHRHPRLPPEGTGAPVSGGCEASAWPGLPREAPPRAQPPPAGNEIPATAHPGRGCSPPPAPVTSTTRPSNLSPSAIALRRPAPDCAAAAAPAGREGQGGPTTRMRGPSPPPCGKCSPACSAAAAQGGGGREPRGGGCFFGRQPRLHTVFPYRRRHAELLVT